jgi:hypothetical protein
MEGSCEGAAVIPTDDISLGLGSSLPGFALAGRN